MDYSKWKKLAIILTIVTLIIHICSTVFGSYEFPGINDTTYILPDVVTEYDYVLIVAAQWNSYVVASNTEFYINERGGNIFVGFKEPSVSYISASKNNSTNYDFSSNTFSSYNAPSYFNGTDKIYQILNVGGGSVRASNYDVKNSITSEVSFESTAAKVPPTIENELASLELLDFDYVKINANGYSNDRFYLDVFDLNGFSDDEIELYQYAMGRKNRILLTLQSPYYNQDLSTSDSSIYWIPKSDLGLTWKEQGKYRFQFVSSVITGSGENELEYLELIGEPVTFTLSQGVALSQIEQANQERLINQNIEQNKNINNQTNILNNSLTNTTPDGSINSDIIGAFDYDNSNDELTSNHDGFFSRLIALFSDMFDYNISDDSVIQIPMPNSEKKIILHSNIISSHISEPLKSLISAFWMYVFYVYCWKFFNYIFITIEEGKILDENSLENVPGSLHTSVF